MIWIVYGVIALIGLAAINYILEELLDIFGVKDSVDKDAE